MKPIAIHNGQFGFHSRWRSYCEENEIPWKSVDCYANDFVRQLKGCSALMWHFSHSKPEDVLIAPAVMQSAAHAGIPTFPDYASSWHFDDKIAQKYLLELFEIPMIKTWLFLERREAELWIEEAEFPKVFKLRRGAGSSSVRLVADRSRARALVERAFGKGFSPYDAWGQFSAHVKRFFASESSFKSVGKAVARLVREPEYSRVLGREKGYAYFQDFIPGADFDIRLIVLGDRAFGLKRFVRKNDFRASGSGAFDYLNENTDPSILTLAFSVADKLDCGCLSLDIIQGPDGKHRVIEFSFGFVMDPYDDAPGYWTRNVGWHPEPPDPMGWIVESVARSNCVK